VVQSDGVAKSLRGLGKRVHKMLRSWSRERAEALEGHAQRVKDGSVPAEVEVQAVDKRAVGSCLLICTGKVRRIMTVFRDEASSSGADIALAVG
jgi:hypothetical protein